ncbi:MAG: transposase [Chloroflexota bacterium]
MNENKRDKVDAEFLARIGRVDPTLLSPLTHRSAATQTDLALLRSRAAVVRARALLINYVRGVVKSGGGRIPHCDARYIARRAGRDLPEELVPALPPAVATIAGMDGTIRAYDKEIESMAEERYPETQLLRQVAGVGPITATTFVLTVEDPSRFPRSRSIGSYLGLRPRLDESGTLKRQLRITKAGDEALRSLLVSCSQYILGHFGPDTDLRRWGLQLAERSGPNGRKRAVVAVAANSRCSCCACGSRARSMSPCATPGSGERRRQHESFRRIEPRSGLSPRIDCHDDVCLAQPTNRPPSRRLRTIAGPLQADIPIAASRAAGSQRALSQPNWLTRVRMDA